MLRSITETLKKINIELKGSAFLSLFLSFILLGIFSLYKVVEAYNLESASQKMNISYEKSNFVGGNTVQNLPKEDSASSKNYANGHFIYASKRGTKYYYYNCRSTLKEANKIYFNSDAEAQKAGYTLAKACQ